MLDIVSDTAPPLEHNELNSDAAAQTTQHGSHDTEQADQADQRSKSLSVKPYRARTSIQSIPEEVLLHVFAQLPAQALAAVERVCRYWFILANSESSWRTAFLTNFGAENVPGRRVDPSSWRGEYILRTKLLQRWRKARSAQYNVDLKISHLTNLAITPNNTSIIASTFTGLGFHRPPNALVGSQTGRRFDGFPSPLLPADEGDSITCVSISTLPAVLWGMRSGNIRINVLSSVGRGESQHLGRLDRSITAIASTEDLCVAVGLDGQVVIWNLASRTIIWAMQEQDRMVDEEMPVKIEKAILAPPYLFLTGQGCIGRYNFRSFDQPVIIAGEQEVAHLEPDLATNAILIHRIGDSHFSRYSYDTSTSTTYSVPSASPITAIAVDFTLSSTTQPFGSTTYVVTGSEDGSVYIHSWSFLSTPRCLQSEGYKITALAITSLLIFVGCLSGQITAFDPLSLQPVRTLNERSINRHALRALVNGAVDERRWRVSSLVVDGDCTSVLAAVGDRLFNYSCREVDGNRSKKRGMRSRVSTRAERCLDDREMHTSVYESQQELREEAEYTQHAQTLRYHNVDGLNDQESLSLAFMLSREDAEFQYYDTDILRRIDDLELTAEEEAMINASSPTDYRQTSASLDPEVDSRWPLPSPSSSPYLQDLASSPKSITTPSKATKVTKGWADVIRSSSSPASSPTKPTPPRNSAASASLLSAQLQEHAVQPEEEEMDEDLRFAIELSLAEERSRAESGGN